MQPAEEEAGPLDQSILERLRQALGAPDSEQVASAMDEVERQVAMEDLVLLLIDSAAGAARAFLDSFVSLIPADDTPREGDSKGDPQ